MRALGAAAWASCAAEPAGTSSAIAPTPRSKRIGAMTVTTTLSANAASPTAAMASIVGDIPP